MLPLQIKKFLNDEIFRNIAKNASFVLAGNTASSIFGIVSFTLMARTLGPSPLALFVLAQTYTFIINDIINVQTWESMIKFGPLVKNNEEHGVIVRTNILIDVSSAILAFTFAVLLAKPVVHLLNWDPLLITIIPVYCFSILFNFTTLTIGVPRLHNKFSFIAKAQTTVAAIKLAAVTVAAIHNASIIVFIMIYLISTILLDVSVSIYSIKLLKAHSDLKIFNRNIRITADQFKFLFWNNLRTIVRIPVRHLGYIFTNAFLTLEMVGVLRVYVEIAGILNKLAEPIRQTTYPEFTKLLSEKMSDHSRKLIRKIIIILSVTGIPIAIIMILFSKLIVVFMFGVEYTSNIGVLYLLIVLAAISLIISPVNSLFVAAGFVKHNFFIITSSNIAYILSVIFSVRHFGLYGLVMASFVQLIINQGLTIKYLKEKTTGWSEQIR